MAAPGLHRRREAESFFMWSLLVSMSVMGLAIANEDCLFEAENGAVYDLRPMKGNQFKVPAVDQQYMYTLSTCGPVNEAPPECASIAPTRSTAAFQVGHGLCFYLGDPKSKMWSSIDRRPELGFDLVYGNGEHCSDGRAREIRCVTAVALPLLVPVVYACGILFALKLCIGECSYHFVCAPSFDMDEPPMYVVETPEKCHYNVTWPSKYGCPTYGGASSTILTHAILFYSLMVTLVCCVLGVAVNVRKGKSLGWEAVPCRRPMEALFQRVSETSVYRWIARRVPIGSRGVSGFRAASEAGASQPFRRNRPPTPDAEPDDGGVFGEDDDFDLGDLDVPLQGSDGVRDRK